VLRVVDPNRSEIVAANPAGRRLADRDRRGGTPGAGVVRRCRDAPHGRIAPAAVEIGTATIPVRLAFAAPADIPAGTPVQVDIDAELHKGVVVLPAVAIVREGEEAAVFVAVDSKARRRAVEIGLSDGATVEILSGVTAGENRDRGRPGRPAGRGCHHHHGRARRRERRPRRDAGRRRAEVNIAALALRHRPRDRLLAAALVISGAIAARALPSAIYPPLQFPRIVIVAHSGTLPPLSMSLIVTRPIEQVVMAVPGIRRVRSTSIRGAAEISAQFDPSTRHGPLRCRCSNRVAEITGGLPAKTSSRSRG
jgi:hypothetical protein